MRFNGKVAVITAAASGICRAAAGIIVKEGGLVVGIDTDEARLEKMSMELSKESAGAIVTYCIDALDPKAADRTLKNIIPNAYKKMKGLDCLINNASVFENDDLNNFSEKNKEYFSKFNQKIKWKQIYK